MLYALALRLPVMTVSSQRAPFPSTYLGVLQSRPVAEPAPSRAVSSPPEATDAAEARGAATPAEASPASATAWPQRGRLINILV